MNYFWFRRDLRLHDNAGFYRALKELEDVQCIFIFDKNILNELPKHDSRVTFIHLVITTLKKQLNACGSDLRVEYGDPVEIWKAILEKEDVTIIYTNRDYEPYAKNRDAQILALSESYNATFKTYKDHVVFEQEEVVKADGSPYTVFTPYKRKWLEKLASKSTDGLSYYFKPYPNEKYLNSLYKSQSHQMISLNEMGFEQSDIPFPDTTVRQGIIKNYDKQRNFPAIDGTSRLGLHFRFGTISIREKASKAQNLNDTYLSELVWRDFYSQILWHYPHVVGNSFRPKYDRVSWRFNEQEFEKWKSGKTGYPMVDAGMRELNTTGYMHNRVRMVVASFFTKHMLHDWRLGEAYFAEKLLDFDLASNNGGWQWAAGCGTDAAPYFRIFNPTSQLEKFDKDLKYTKKWVPEYGTSQYPKPMVDHKEARERCLSVYKEALSDQN